MNRMATVAISWLVSWNLYAEASTAEPASQIAQDDETLEWLDNYDEAIALAKETGRPLFLEFRCAP